jgi:transcription elongation factor Elf1
MTDDDIPDMDAILAEMGAAMGIKDKLKARQLTAAKCRCPHCNETGAAIARLAGPRKHLHLNCRACGYLMME